MSELAFLFLVASISNGLPPGLLDSICYVESNHNPKALHRHDGDGTSYGVCQIKLATARQQGFTGKPTDLLNPEVNVVFAAKYLKYQLNRYKGNYAKAITGYNKGSSTSHGGSEYLAKVFQYWVTHERVEGRISYARESNRDVVSEELPQCR